MARTQIRGGDQILNFTVLQEDLVLDFLNGSDWDITNGANNATITGLSAGVNANDAVNKSQLDAALAGLSSGIEYKGILDASDGTAVSNFEAAAHSKGDFYKITGDGSISGVAFNSGDNLIINSDVSAGNLTGSEIDKIDNTEAADILRTGDVVDNLTSTATTAPLSANQGKTLKDLLDTLGARVNDRTYGESKAVTHNSAVLPALNNTPVAGTERVYLNGIRMERGSGNDYTISGSVITFEYNLKTNDKVLVDYEY